MLASDAKIDLVRTQGFSLGAARVRPALLEISLAGKTEVVERRVMQLLVALKAAKGAPVPRDTLVAQCWGGLAVSDDAINQCVSKLRRALAAAPWAKIETVPRVGYRLVTVGEPDDARADPPPHAKPSIAVMPFANLNEGPDQAYFVDGVVREITSILTRFRTLSVVAPTATRALTGRSPLDVARHFGVRYVLEGAVRKDGGRVRVAVSLVDGADGAQAWADRFDETLEDVFGLQDRVATAVAARMAPEIMRAEVKRVSARPPIDPTAYDLYLRASPHLQSRTREGLLLARELLDRAIALDPNHGPALWSAANVRAWLVSSRWSADPEADRRIGLELAEQAVKAASDNAFGLAMVGNAFAVLNDTHRAESLLAQALRINPADAMVWNLSGNLRRLLGDLDVAVEHYETALRLAPFERWPDAGLITCRFLQHRFDEALQLLERTNSPAPICKAVAASLYGHLGRAAEASRSLTDYEAVCPVPVEDFAREWFHKPEHRSFFLQGVVSAAELRKTQPR